MKVYGLSKDDKTLLKEIALKKTGKASLSNFVKHLLMKELSTETIHIPTAKKDLNSIADRLEIRLSKANKTTLETLAKTEGMSINSYISLLLHGYVTKEPQLTTNEVQAIRESNYQLYKIGNNLNQVAKALNMEEVSANSVKLEAIESLQAMMRQHMLTVHPLIEKNYNQL